MKCVQLQWSCSNTPKQLIAYLYTYVRNMHISAPHTLQYRQPLKQDLRLLQVDEETLQHVLAGRASFKGHPDGEAVLCTSTATFAIKTVETTNKILLLPNNAAVVDQHDEDKPRTPLSLRPNTNDAMFNTGIGMGLLTQMQQDTNSNPPMCVTAVASSTLETVKIAPHMDTLDTLLQASALGAQEEALGIDTSAGHTWEELLAAVPASEVELKQALEARHALLLQDRWRTVEDGCVSATLKLLLSEAAVQGWQVDEHGAWHVPVHAACAALKQHADPRLVEHCINVFGSTNASTQANTAQGGPPGAKDTSPGSNTPAVAARDDGNGGGGDTMDEQQEMEVDAESRVVVLDPAKICRHAALQLLRQQECWSWDDFEQAWRAAVPEGMRIDQRALKGEVIWSGTAPDQHLKRFRAAELPADPAARFDVLFQERALWLWDDLEPYVSSMAGNAEAVLLKYARLVQPHADAPVQYTRR